MSLPAIVSPSPVAELAARARALRPARGEGAPPMLLKGRNIGVLCEAAGHAEALLAQQAALELGAQVALLPPGFAEAGAAPSLGPTVRMLERLYDALVCIALPPALEQRLREEAAVPVLAGRPEAGELAPEERQLVWQGLLLDVLG